MLEAKRNKDKDWGYHRITALESL